MRQLIKSITMKLALFSIAGLLIGQGLRVFSTEAYG